MPNLDKLFAPFEGTRDPYPLAIVRIACFVGIAVHFLPSLIWLDIGYGRGAVRQDTWNHWLFTQLWHIPPAVLRAMSIVTITAIVAGIVGFRPRLAALVAGAGCYVFASFNAIHLQTLALVSAWAVLTLWAICGGGNGALSVDAWLGKRVEREKALVGSLLLYQVLLAVWFSGIEKLLAGWPLTNEMAIVLAYPKGFMVRDWVADLPFLHGPIVSTTLTWLTLVVELGAPILLVFRRTRVAALVAYELFFLGIIAMLEVPPLFYFIFASVPLLALDDAQLASARAALVRRFAREHRASTAPRSPA